MSMKLVIWVFLTVLSGKNRLLVQDGAMSLRQRIPESTLIVSLPGSLKAVQDGMDVLIPLLPHALEMIAGKGH
jgi:molybdopterin biosynthesis enzyme MoaB